MLMAMFAYALNDAFVKATAHALPAGQVLAVRGVFATACVLLVMQARRQPAWRGLAFHPLLALRCGLEITTALSSVLALTRAPLATVTAIMMSAPLIVSIVSSALGWESWQPRRLVLTLIGLAGVLASCSPGAVPLRRAPTRVSALRRSVHFRSPPVTWSHDACRVRSPRAA